MKSVVEAELFNFVEWLCMRLLAVGVSIARWIGPPTLWYESSTAKAGKRGHVLTMVTDLCRITDCGSDVAGRWSLSLISKSKSKRLLCVVNFALAYVWSQEASRVYVIKLTKHPHGSNMAHAMLYGVDREDSRWTGRQTDEGHRA